MKVKKPNKNSVLYKYQKISKNRDKTRSRQDQDKTLGYQDFSSDLSGPRWYLSKSWSCLGLEQP